MKMLRPDFHIGDLIFGRTMPEIYDEFNRPQLFKERCCRIGADVFIVYCWEIGNPPYSPIIETDCKTEAENKCLEVSKKNHVRVFVRRNGRDYFCSDFK